MNKTLVYIGLGAVGVTALMLAMSKKKTTAPETQYMPNPFPKDKMFKISPPTYSKDTATNLQYYGDAETSTVETNLLKNNPLPTTHCRKFDGTGPYGAGPMTGRSCGSCASRRNNYQTMNATEQGIAGQFYNMK